MSERHYNGPNRLCILFKGMSGLKISATRHGDLIKFLSRLEEKLDAPVLNGGFELLFQKVDNIEKSVDKLNEAVFNPEKGLFVRVQTEKVETDHDVEKLIKRVDDTEEKLKLYRKFIVGAVLSVITMIGKIIWDAVAGHITFH